MKRPELKRMLIVIAVCAVVGAVAGVAGSAAAPSTKSAAKKQRMALKHAFRAGPHRLGFGFGFGPVHATAVVPNRDGTGFHTVTTDAGTLNSVDGTTVHIKEGTAKATYKDDVAIGVGSDAKVFRNGKKATLGDLKQGDRVHVITGGPRGNVVVAADDAFLQQQKKRFERGFHRHGFGPGGAGDPPPPPPGDPNQP